MNTGREVTQFGGNWPATTSDIWIGNRGALMGQHLTTYGIHDVSNVWGQIMERH